MRITIDIDGDDRTVGTSAVGRSVFSKAGPGVVPPHVKGPAFYIPGDDGSEQWILLSDVEETRKRRETGTDGAPDATVSQY